MSTIRILIIEPDPVVSAGFAAMLRNHLYDVDSAPRGAEGMVLLTNRHFDLAVLDRCLPDMDGCALCGTIREIDDHIPLLMLATGGREAMMQGFAAGADDCLLLPADNREFLARIRVLIRRVVPLPHLCNRLKTGDIVLDTDSKQVSKGGHPVAVTASEFPLLEYMMRNKDRVVTKEELAVGAWGQRRFDRLGQLSTHMNNLRKKLRDDTLPCPIYTVSGKGYLLIESKPTNT